MNILTRIAERALNRPLLLLPERAALITAVLSGRIKVDASELVPDASRFFGESSESDPATGSRRSLPYRRTESGVAIISVVGSLVNRGAWVGASCGLVSYEGIKYQLQQAGNDPKATAVILDIDSPGGEAVGAFEVADEVRALAAKKRVVAVVNGIACSAAYAIASGATEIVTTQTGVSGSIGVVMLHVDYSEALADEGVKPTLIFAGAHKVDGNPFEPLPKAVKAELQDEVNSFRALFLQTVALGRGQRLTEDAARQTEARSYIGGEAVNVGLADRIGTFESVLTELSSRAPTGRSTSRTSKGASMSETTGAPAAENVGISKAEHDTAVTTARAEGHKAGAVEATTRIKAILTHEAAKGREAQAQVLAFETTMDAEASIKVLEASAKATASSSLAQRQANNPANTAGSLASEPQSSARAIDRKAAFKAVNNR